MAGPLEGERKPDNPLPRNNPELRPRIADEQISLLLRRRIELPVNLLAAGIVGVIFWPLCPPWVVLGWLGIFGLVILARAWLRQRFLKASPDAAGMRRWRQIFTLSALATASLWGATGFVALVTPDPAYHIFIVFVLGGVMAAGLVSNSAFLPAMIAFQLPTVLPIIVVLLSHADRISIAMATMLSIFAAILLATGREINRSVTENFRLRLEQQVLLDERRRESAVAANLAAIVDSSDDAIASRSLTGEVVSWNRGAERVFGYGAQEMIGKNILAIIPEDRRAEFDAKQELLKSGARIEPFDTERLHKNGRRIPVSLAVSPKVDSEGRLVGASCIARDITERLEADRALAHRDRLLHAVTIGAATLVKTPSLAGAIPEALRLLGETLKVDRVLVLQRKPTPGLAYIWQSPSARPQLEDAAFSVSALDVPELVAWRSQMDAGEPLMAHLATSEGAVRDFLTRHGNQSILAVPILAGTRVWGSLGIDSCSAVREWTEYEIDTLKIFGEIMGSLIVRGETAVALEDSLERFRTVAITAQDGIITVDAAGRIALWNPAAERILGYSAAEAIGKPVSHFVAPAFRPDTDRAVATFISTGAGDTIGKTTELRALRKDGTEITVEISLAAQRLGDGWGGVGILRDITDRKAAEEKLLFANTLLKSEMEASRSGILVIDFNLKVVMFNHRFTEIWNIPPEHLLGATLPELMAYAKPLLTDPAKFAAGVDELVDHRDRFDQEEYPLTDGRIINRDILTLFGPGKEYLGHVAYFRDVTERRNADEKLQFANLLLKTQMEASLDGVLVVDAKMKIIAFNKRVADIWHIPLADLEKGDDPTVLARVASMVKDRETFSAGVKYLYEHIHEDSQDEFETLDGRFIERYAVPLTATTGKHLGRAWFFRDITERKQATAYAIRMARYDTLTGLANRAVFVEALEHAIAATKRGDKKFAVIYLDLDHFKDINDTLGHPIGDELLKKVADLLRSITRETDTVARFGGDEFAVVVTDIADSTGAAILAKKLIAALSVPFRIGDNEIHTGASIGIATYNADVPDAETLLSHADVALYRTKSEGRGGYRFFTEAMDTEVQSRVKLGAELRDAIEGGQLFLMYQPQVAIDDGRIVGVEALVRWRHPHRGTLGPDLFIPVAEQIGAVTRLGHWVLWEACQQARRWHDAGIAPVRIAVNVSVLQFKAPIALEDDVVAALRETGLAPNLLELELTESVLMGVAQEHRDVLRRLRESGVTIAIDDFGTGYSSLEYLRRFPANRIKIAQVFVRELESNSDDAAIVRATIGLARELGIEVIAEGVETDAQAKLIAGWGCPEAQGYLFAPPLDVEDATVALRAGNLQPRVSAEPEPEPDSAPPDAAKTRH